MGAITISSVYIYLHPHRTTMWLFNNNYKAGTALTDDMLYPVQVDSKVNVAGAYADTSTQFITGADKTAIINSGDSLRIDVAQGYPLTKGMLSVNGGTATELGMDPTKTCVTIPCNSITGISDNLARGSRINICATAMTGQPTTTLIFQSLKVVNTSIKDGNLQSITVEVSVEDSLKLINYQNTSTLQCTLVDQTGYQFANDGIHYTANVDQINKNVS